MLSTSSIALTNCCSLSNKTSKSIHKRLVHSKWKVSQTQISGNSLQKRAILSFSCLRHIEHTTYREKKRDTNAVKVVALSSRDLRIDKLTPSAVPLGDHLPPCALKAATTTLTSLLEAHTMFILFNCSCQPDLSVPLFYSTWSSILLVLLFPCQAKVPLSLFYTNFNSNWH